VHAIDHIARKALKQALVDHLLGAGTALFGRLKDEVHDAIEPAMQGQPARAGEQHGRVAIVAAGMHAPLVLRGMIKGVVLLQGQGIHIGPQTDGARAAATPEGAHHAGATDAGGDLKAPGLEFFGHDGRSAVLFVAQLRVSMQITADGLDFGLQVENAFGEHHGVALLVEMMGG